MMPTARSLAKRLVPGPAARLWRRFRHLPMMERNLFIGVPEATKRLVVSTARQRLGYPVLVETGTYRAEMALHAAGLFDEVHTIELDPELARQARERLGALPHVSVHEGDSGRVLQELLPRIERSCVFWLDAHYSGGVTARGDRDNPLLAELRTIARHPVRPHAVLIDDARMFGVDPAYPKLEEVFPGLREIDPAYCIGVIADIIWAARVPLLEFGWESNGGTPHKAH